MILLYQEVVNLDMAAILYSGRVLGEGDFNMRHKSMLYLGLQINSVIHSNIYKVSLGEKTLTEQDMSQMFDHLHLDSLYLSDSPVGVVL